MDFHMSKGNIQCNSLNPTRKKIPFARISTLNTVDQTQRWHMQRLVERFIHKHLIPDACGCFNRIPHGTPYRPTHFMWRCSWWPLPCKKVVLSYLVAFGVHHRPSPYSHTRGVVTMVVIYCSVPFEYGRHTLWLLGCAKIHTNTNTHTYTDEAKTIIKKKYCITNIFNKQKQIPIKGATHPRDHLSIRSKHPPTHSPIHKHLEFSWITKRFTSLLIAHLRDSVKCQRRWHRQFFCSSFPLVCLFTHLLFHSLWIVAVTIALPRYSAHR